MTSCFVQFKTVDDVNNVLSHGIHRIDHIDLEVKAADLWEQPSHILNALNEDVLHKIFLYLIDMKDLVNAAQVCVRFNKYATEVFTKKYKDLELPGELNAAEVNDLLKHFGPMIRSLEVDKNVLHYRLISVNDFASAVSEHCTALKDLQLVNFKIERELDEKIRPLFTKLEMLKLTLCELKDDGKHLMSACVNLKTLVLCNCDLYKGKSIDQQFDKLEEARIIGSNKLRNTVIFFIKRNPQLIKLMVNNTQLELSKLFQAVGTRLPNLIELDINYFHDTADRTELANHISVLSRLTLLKVLKLNFGSLPVAALVSRLAADNVPIEHLKIINGKINDDAINNISKLINIKVLEIVNIKDELTDQHLVQLAKVLPELQELNIAHIPSELTMIGLKEMLSHAKKLSHLVLKFIKSIAIDINDYKAMLNMVQNRNRNNKLLIELWGTGGMVNVPDAILAENRDVFYIEEKFKDKWSREAW